jgi:hypothetical protein
MIKKNKVLYRRRNQSKPIRFEILDPEPCEEFEDSGYLSVAQRIQMFQRSGQILAQGRQLQYDIESDRDIDIDDVDFPAYRSPNYDYADATQELLAIQRRIYARKQEQLRAKANAELAADEISKTDGKSFENSGSIQSAKSGDTEDTPSTGS